MERLVEDMPQDDGNSYRMVSREYFCFVCQKTAKKMVQVAELELNGLTCDSCQQGFVEILDSSNKGQLQEMGIDANMKPADAIAMGR